MRLNKILLTVLITLAFTATANADGDKVEVCKKAETSFWDTIQNANSSTDQSFVGSLEEQVQVSYYKMALGQIEQSITEVRKSCKGIASKDILDAYEKKKSEIQSQMNAL